jgi:hypothetical protein
MERNDQQRLVLPQGQTQGLRRAQQIAASTRKAEVRKQQDRDILRKLNQR